MNTPATGLDALPPRDRILETAARLFYAEGLRGVGIDRIIAESQTAKASFYRYFPSKDDLVLAYLQRRHDRWMAWFRARLDAVGAARGERLANVADVLREWFAEPDFRGCAFIKAWGEGSLATAGASVAQTHKDELLTVLAALARRAGIAAPKRVAARALLIVEGAIVRAHMGGGAAVADDAAALLALLDGGARAAPSPAAARRRSGVAR